MRARKVLNIAFVLLAASFAIYGLFPRFENDFSCDSSVPKNAAQATALADARSRKTRACSSSQRLCKFLISDEPDGFVRVSLYYVESSFFDGCVFKEQDLEVFAYSREGKFARIEGAPYE